MDAGPVSVVVPKVAPEKRSKQETQHITLPTRDPKKSGAEAGLLRAAPIVPRPQPSAGARFAGSGPTSPVSPPVVPVPAVQATQAQPSPDTARVARPSATIAASPTPLFPPIVPRHTPVMAPPVTQKPGTPKPGAPESVSGVAATPESQAIKASTGTGRGPFASVSKGPKEAVMATPVKGEEPRPKKEYAKFFQAEPKAEAVSPEKREPTPPRKEGPLGVAVERPAPAAAEVRPVAREKPQGFPWMVPARVTKKDVPVPIVRPPVTLPPVFKGSATGGPSATLAKKATDVIADLRGVTEVAKFPKTGISKGGPQAAVPAPVQQGEPESHAAPSRPLAEGGAGPAEKAPKKVEPVAAKVEKGGPSAEAKDLAGPGESPAGKGAAEATPQASAIEIAAEISPAPSEKEAQPESALGPREGEGRGASAEDAREAELASLGPAWLEAFDRERVIAGKAARRDAKKAAAVSEIPAKGPVPHVEGSGVAVGAEPMPAAKEAAPAVFITPAETVPPLAGPEAEVVEEPIFEMPALEDMGAEAAAEEAGGGGTLESEGEAEIRFEAEEPAEPSDLSEAVAEAAAVVPSDLAGEQTDEVMLGAPPAEGGDQGGTFGPSTIALPAAVPIRIRATTRKKTDRIPQPGPSGNGGALASAVPPEVSARALRLADAISGAGAKDSTRGPVGAVRDWIEDHLPLLLVTGLLLTVGATVFALWRSAEGKAISEVGFWTPADFQTFQKGMSMVRDGKLREAVDAIRASATRVSADPGLRTFYLELRAALGEAPSTTAEIGGLLQAREAGPGIAARILTWEAAWHHPNIDGRMRAADVLSRLGATHRLPLAEREIRRALGDSADAALGPRPGGLDGYRWDERFVRWYYLRAATGDNDARDRLIAWVKDPQTDRIRREAASLALLALDEPDAEKIVHDVWQEQMRIEAINFRVTTSRALGIDGGKLPPEEVRRIRDWATKEVGFSIARAFGLLYEHGIPSGLELLDTTARNDGVYGFPAMAAVAELNRVLGGKALGRMAAIREYWRAELEKLRADPKEAASEVGQTFQKVMGRIIEAVTIEMARAGDEAAAKEVTAGLSAENDFDKVQAALKLGERGLEVAMPMLVDIAKGAEKPVASQEEKKEVKRVLLEDGRGPVAKAYLEGLLQDADAATRFGAACRLLELHLEAQPKAVPPADLSPPKAAK